MARPSVRAILDEQVGPSRPIGRGSSRDPQVQAERQARLAAEAREAELREQVRALKAEIEADPEIPPAALEDALGVQADRDAVASELTRQDRIFRRRMARKT